MTDKSIREQAIEALSSMTDKEYAFWQAMDSGKHTQIQAYRLAYDAQNMQDNSVAVAASRLWNSDKFTLMRQALAEGKLQQSARTREERIANMDRLALKAEVEGKYIAAIQAQEKAGKLEGHYIDKSEHTQIKADMTTETYLEKVLELYGKETMESVAARKGIPQDTVNKVLSTVH